MVEEEVAAGIAASEETEMEEARQQWMADMDVEELQAWKLRARERLCHTLEYLKSSGVLSIRWKIFVLVALDVSDLEPLERVLATEPQIVKNISIHIDRPRPAQQVFGGLSTDPWEPEVPPPLVVRHMASLFGRLLRMVVSAVEVDCHSSPVSFVTTVITSLPIICQLDTTFCDGDSDGSADELAALAEGVRLHGASLTRVAITFASLEMLRSVCPVLLTLPKLSKLCLVGTSRERPILSTTSDASLISQLLTKDSLENFDLDYIEVTSNEAASSICKALRSCKLNKLRLGNRVVIPSSMGLDVVQSVAGSRIRNLDFCIQVTEEAIHAFAPELTASTSFSMVNLRVYIIVADLDAVFNGDPLRTIRLNNYYCFHYPVGSGLHTKQLSDEWTAPVKRRLDINRERESTLPVFEKFQKQEKSRQPVQFAEVFAVHPVIVFDCLRRDAFSVQKAIREFDSRGSAEVATTGDSLQRLDASSPDRKRRCLGVEGEGSKPDER